jgi:hypothetical protein
LLVQEPIILKTNANFANMSFLDKMKKAGKSVVDAGAKTMLKVSLLRAIHSVNIFLDLALASPPRFPLLSSVSIERRSQLTLGSLCCDNDVI